MKRTFFVFMMAFLLLGQPSAAAFSDVGEGDWYHGAVHFVSERNLMDGVGDDLFAPGTFVTRATVVTVLHRLERTPAPATTAQFSDVDNDAWYAAAAAWAQEAGIAAGYSSGAFGPDDFVTREQLAMFLYRYASHKGQELGEGVLGAFADRDKVSEWALDGVHHAVGVGLLTGKDGNLLDPGGTASRAELAAILQRLLTPAAG